MLSVLFSNYFDFVEAAGSCDSDRRQSNQSFVSWVGQTILTKKRVSILATALLSIVPMWSPTPASSMPNMGMPTRA